MRFNLQNSSEKKEEIGNRDEEQRKTLSVYVSKINKNKEQLRYQRGKQH
jgi:hypothetical protein